LRGKRGKREAKPPLCDRKEKRGGLCRILIRNPGRGAKGEEKMKLFCFFRERKGGGRRGTSNDLPHFEGREGKRAKSKKKEKEKRGQERRLRLRPSRFSRERRKKRGRSGASVCPPSPQGWRKERNGL